MVLCPCIVGKLSIVSNIIQRRNFFFSLFLIESFYVKEIYVTSSNTVIQFGAKLIILLVTASPHTSKASTNVSLSPFRVRLLLLLSIFSPSSLFLLLLPQACLEFDRESKIFAYRNERCLVQGNCGDI